MKIEKFICAFTLCASTMILSATQSFAEPCKTKKVSEDFMKALQGLQYRVRSGLNYEKIQGDLKELSADANCRELKIVQAISIEADAFSRSPQLALPALVLLYQNTAKDNPRYHRVLRALGKNYAALGRVDDVSGLLGLHPDAPEHILEYWQTSLALAHAQNGNLDEAVSVIESAEYKGEPTQDRLQVAIAIYDLVGNEKAIEALRVQADEALGGLRWPRALDGMGTQHFEVLYRRRFDPALSDATPILPPRPYYPEKAIDGRKEGECEVHFDVSKEGIPINVEAECSANVFVAEAKRAISEVRFEPLVYKGTTYNRYNIVYPLSFTLSYN